MQPELAAAAAHRRLVARHQARDARVREALALQAAHARSVQTVEALGFEQGLLAQQILDLRQEPGVDLGGVEHLLQRPAGAKCVAHVQDPVRPRPAQFVRQFFDRCVRERMRQLFVEAVVAQLQTAQRLLQRFLEGAADGHDLAHRFHLRGQAGVGAGKFLEREAWNLGDHVIDGGLERCRRAAAGDLVLEFIERVAHGELGGDLGDRKARGLGRERRGARHARIHFDHQHPAVVRIDRELHVGAAGIDADLAQHRNRRIAQSLVLAVGQRLRRRHRDRVARVHAHGIQVLDGTHDDAVVVPVPDHFHFVFFPAQHRLLEQHLVGGRSIEAAAHDGLELLAVVGDAAAAAAHGEGRPDHGREADFRLHRQRLLHAVRDARPRGLQADVRHGAAEQLAVLGHVDGTLGRADHLDVVFLEHALARQVQGRVERRLSAHGWQERARPFLIDDAFDGSPVDRLDVDAVRGFRIRHDGGRIGVHQNDSIALFFQGLARLSSRIVELACLADDDGPGTDDEDAAEVGSFRHGATLQPIFVWRNYGCGTAFGCV